MTTAAITHLPRLRAVRQISVLPLDLHGAMDHIAGLACCLVQADAAAIVILQDGTGRVIGRDGVDWQMMPLCAETAAGTLPFGAGHPLRSGAIDRLDPVLASPIRMDGTVIGCLLAGRRQRDREPFGAADAQILSRLADSAAGQIRTEAAMARLAHSAQMAVDAITGLA